MFNSIDVAFSVTFKEGRALRLKMPRVPTFERICSNDRGSGPRATTVNGSGSVRISARASIFSVCDVLQQALHLISRSLFLDCFQVFGYCNDVFLRILLAVLYIGGEDTRSLGHEPKQTSPDGHFGCPVGTRHLTSINNLDDLIHVENTVSTRRQLAKRRRSGLELHGHRTIASGILPMASSAEIFVIQGAHLDLFSQRFGLLFGRPCLRQEQDNSEQDQNQPTVPQVCSLLSSPLLRVDQSQCSNL